MALDAESVVSHWSVMGLTWTGATSSRDRRPSSLGVAFPSAVSTAPLPGFRVSLVDALLPRSCLQLCGPQDQVWALTQGGLGQDRLERKAPCSPVGQTRYSKPGLPLTTSLQGSKYRG